MPQADKYQQESLRTAPDTPKKEFEPGGSFLTLIYPLIAILAHFFVQAWVGVRLAARQLMEKGSYSGPELEEALYDVVTNPETSARISIYTGLILIPILLVFLAWRKRKNPYALMNKGVTSKDVKDSLYLLLAGQGLSVVWLILLAWLSQYSSFVYERMSRYDEIMSMIAGRETNVVLLIVSTSIVVPLLEELIYRGVVIGELRPFMSNKAVLFWQALIFGLVHADFVQSIYAFVLALVIGYIYLRYENFILCFLAHAFFNFIGGALPQILSVGSPVLSMIRIIELAALASLALTIIRKKFLNSQEVA